VFSALPAEIAQTVEWRLAETGHVVCSNASAYRMHEHVPILLPEINAPHAALVRVQRQKYGWGTGGLVTNSNCTSAPVAMAFAPLRPFGIVAAQLTSLQAVSGGGYPGVPSLDILDNVIPFINGEEPKLEAEPRKMLGALEGERIADLDYAASATCTRVPVLDGHLVSVAVRFREAVSDAQIIAAWEDFRGPEPVPSLPSAPPQPVIYHRAPDRPQPRRDREPGTVWRRSSGGYAPARSSAAGSSWRWPTTRCAARRAARSSTPNCSWPRDWWGRRRESSVFGLRFWVRGADGRGARVAGGTPP